MNDTKKCPYCGEEIKAVAKKCRFCGQWFDEESNEVKANEEVKPQNDASVEQVVPKGEEVKPQTESPIKQSASKEEVKDDNKTPYTVSKPNSGTNSKVGDKSNKNTVYWVVGIIAAVLLVGFGFLLGNKGSGEESVTQELPAVTHIDEEDPNSLIKQRIEALYTDVFNSPEANCESRYLSTDFYNLYVQARDIEQFDAAQWKKKIWLNGEEWRKMTANVTEIRDLPAGGANVYLELTDNNGNKIKNVFLTIEDAKGNCRIKDIAYAGISVKDGIESFVGKNKPQKATVDDNEVYQEVSRKYTVIGKDEQQVYFLKGRKGQYDPYLYHKSLSTGSEIYIDFKHYYDGSMQIEDYAFNNGKVTLIIRETDRNSTGFLEATLVITVDPKNHSVRELTDGGCVKAEFNGSKSKITLTYGTITNPDAQYTYEYKYKYTTKVISL